MNYMILVNHGSGAEFMQVSALREFARQHKDDKVYVSAVNKYFADCLESELDNVKSVDRSQLYPVMVQAMTSKNDWIVYQPEVYQDWKFSSRCANYYDVFWKQTGVNKTANADANGAEYTPYLKAPADIVNAVREFASQHKKFVIFQRAGGVNPISPHEERMQHANKESGLLRAWPVDYSEKLVEKLNAKGYEVLQYCLPEEVHIKGCIYLQQEANQLFYMELAKYAAGVITIDSSLMHLAIHNCKNMIVIWAQSMSDSNSCIGFGYKKAANLFAGYSPIVPYFTGLADTPVIDYVAVDSVLEQVDKWR